MIPRNTKLKFAVEGCIGSILVAFAILIVYYIILFLTAWIFAGNSPVSEWGVSIARISILFVILSGLLYMLAVIFSVWEILCSRKSVLWKLGWMIICLFISLIGMPIYYFWGRKSL